MQVPNVNAIGTLLERCQKWRWSMPVFTVNAEGPDHAKVFSCLAVMTVNGTPFRGESVGMTTKKAAEQHAAAEILKRLPQMVDEAETQPLPVMTTPDGPKHPVSVLLEWTHKNHFKHPDYRWHQLPQGFRCVCSFALERQKPCSAEGVGATKQEAKTAAAAAGVAKLESWVLDAPEEAETYESPRNVS